MVLFILLFAQTVPYEYPYYQVVERELSFVPMPNWADSTFYERELNLEHGEDSLTFTVQGILKESWLSSRNAVDTRERLDPMNARNLLACDSVSIKGDTVCAYSALCFVFSRLDASIISLNLSTAMRFADSSKVEYTSDEILARLGLGSCACRVLLDAKSLTEFELEPGDVVVLLNLTTGAAALVEREGAPSEAHRRLLERL